MPFHGNLQYLPVSRHCLIWFINAIASLQSFIVSQFILNTPTSLPAIKSSTMDPGNSTSSTREPPNFVELPPPQWHEIRSWHEHIARPNMEILEAAKLGIYMYIPRRDAQGMPKGCQEILHVNDFMTFFKATAGPHCGFLGQSRSLLPHAHEGVMGPV